MIIVMAFHSTPLDMYVMEGTLVILGIINSPMQGSREKI